MPPRFMQRMQRQSDVLRDVFGDPQNDPPPYPFSPSRNSSSSSTFQYRRSGDLSAYQGRMSQDSMASSSVAGHQRHASTQSTSSRYQRGSADGNSEAPSYSLHAPPGYAQATSPVREGFDITAIPGDSLVLVTGANSFHGMYIVDKLLQHGYRVRGTVRESSKALPIAKYFSDRYGVGRFTTYTVPDMAAQYAFDVAVRDCSGIIHVASVTTSSPDPHQVITPSIAGAVNVLNAAAKDSTVRRVVLTSSIAAAVSRNRETRSVVDKDSWNLLEFEDAWSPPPCVEEEVGARVAAVAACSKMQMEQAAWRWYWERRPGFVMNTVLPDTLWGAPLTSPSGQKQHPQSITLLSNLLRQSTPDHLPSTGHFTHPSDSASLHLAALLFPDVQNERIFAISGSWTRESVEQSVMRILAACSQMAADGGSGLQTVWEGEQRGRASMESVIFKESGRAEAFLRRMGREGWRGLEESLRDCIEGFSL